MPCDLKEAAYGIQIGAAGSGSDFGAFEDAAATGPERESSRQIYVVGAKQVRIQVWGLTQGDWPRFGTTQKLLDFRAKMPDLACSMPAEPLGPSGDLTLNSGGFFYAQIPGTREIQP